MLSKIRFFSALTSTTALLLLSFNLTWAANDASKTPTKTESDSTPEVVLVTDLGKIVIQLHPNKAPKSVENFLNYVNSGFYDGVIFHRVIANFMVQTGGLTDKFVKKPTQTPIINESYGGLPNVKGSVAMARTNMPNSATSQFFINVKDNAFLNASGNKAGYAVFGTVTKGMDVAVKMTGLPQGKHRHSGHVNAPNAPIYIQKAFVRYNDIIETATKLEKPPIKIAAPKIKQP